MSKARNLSDFISDPTISSTEIADLAVTHAKLHTTMDLSSKTVTLPTLSTLNTTGNVGIGTSSPARQLSIVDDGTNGQAMMEVLDSTNNNVSGIFLGRANNTNIGGMRYFHATDHLALRSNDVDALIINSTGNVGIGTDSPSTMLHLSAGTTGSVGGSHAGITMTNKYDNPDNSWSIKPAIQGVSNTGLEIRDVTDNRSVMVFNGSGNVGIGLSTNIASKLHVNSELSLGPDNNNRMIVGSTSGGVGSIGTIENGTASFSTMTFKGGNVGIGTSSPAAPLNVSIPAIAAGTDLQKQGIVVTTPFTSGYQNQSSGLLSGYDGNLHGTAIGMVYESPGYALTFFTNDNTSGLPIERMRINDNGRLGIGTASPSYPLHIQGAGHQRIKVEKTDAGGDADISIAGPSDSVGWVLFTDRTAGSNSGAIKYVHSTNKMHFRTNDVDDRLVITSDGIVETPINVTQGGMKHNGADANPPARYLGASGANFGTCGIYRTPTIQSSASNAATSQFLTIYSSGHWAEYPVFRFRVYGTYYTGGYREYVGQVAYSTASFTEVHNTSSSSFIGGGGGHTITMSNAIQVTAHAGQPRHKRDFTLNASNTYSRCYVVVEIAYGGNRYYSSATSTATMDANGSSGGSYHFKTMSLASGQGTFIS